MKFIKLALKESNNEINETRSGDLTYFNMPAEGSTWLSITLHVSDKEISEITHREIFVYEYVNWVVDGIAWTADR